MVGNISQHFRGYEIEGNAQMLLELENNVSAVLSFSGYKNPVVNETHFYLTDGAIKVCYGKGVWVSSGGEYKKVKIKKQDTFEVMMNEFINSINSHTNPSVGGEYGMEIIKHIEAIYNMKG